jgi:hypothetical protein
MLFILNKFSNPRYFRWFSFHILKRFSIQTWSLIHLEFFSITHEINFSFIQGDLSEINEWGILLPQIWEENHGEFEIDEWFRSEVIKI